MYHYDVKKIHLLRENYYKNEETQIEVEMNIEHILGRTGKSPDLRRDGKDMDSSDPAVTWPRFLSIYIKLN